jgi:hypothetical protein
MNTRMQAPNRRGFVRTLLGFLVMSGLSSRPDLVAGEPNPADREQDDTSRRRNAVQRGRQFLVSLLDPDLGLLPEFRGSNVYWLYHDNYLAAKVLEPTNPEISHTIRKAIQSFGIRGSGKIEILFDEVEQPLPFRHHRLDEERRVGGKIVKTEVAGGPANEGWQDYADLLFMAAIAEARRNPETARDYLTKGLATWDGTGFRDRVNRKSRLYATYKLALARIASARFNAHPEIEPALLDRLLASQRNDGGIVTDYDAQGLPIGEANVETTSLAILALES